MTDEPIGRLIAYTQTLAHGDASALEVAALLAVMAMGVWIAVRMYRERR